MYVFICIALSYDGRMGRMVSVGDDTPILGAPIRVRVPLDSPILWIDMYIPSADAWHRQRRELCH